MPERLDDKNRSIATLTQQVQALKDVDNVALPVIDRTTGEPDPEIIGGYLSGNIDRPHKFVRVPLSDNRLPTGQIVLQAIRYAITDKKDEAFCHHAYEGHDKTSVDRVFHLVAKAIEDGTYTLTHTDRMVFTGAEADLIYNGGFNTVPRIVISAETYIGPRRQYLFQEVGDLISTETPDRQCKLIAGYARELGIPFAVLTGIAAQMNINDIVGVFSDKQKAQGIERASIVQSNGGLINVLQKDLIRPGIGFTRSKYAIESAVQRILNSDLGKKTSGLQRLALEQRFLLGKFESTPLIAFPTQGELIMRHADASFRDPARTEFAIDTRNRTVLVTRIVTAFNHTERLPFTDEEKKDRNIIRRGNLDAQTLVKFITQHSES